MNLIYISPRYKVFICFQCFDLDEKERYKRLLQQFSVPVSDKSITQDRRSIALSRLSTRPTTSTVIDQSSM